MKIDLHIHSRDGSDGKWPLGDIFGEAARRGIDLISITDHDSIEAQGAAARLAREYGMGFIHGIELNVTLAHPDYKGGKGVSLDFLGYGFDVDNAALRARLTQIRDFRIERARRILDNLNAEFDKEGLAPFTAEDLDAIQETVDGAFGRPHIANYLVERGIVRDRQEAFDKYLVKCNVAKLPLSLEEAAGLIHAAGGKLFLAHPADPNGTSLVAFSADLAVQQQIIEDRMLGLIDGIECWHSRLSPAVTEAYLDFSRRHGLLVSGGSDCHQQPPLMGSVAVPDYVAEQFAAYVLE